MAETVAKYTASGVIANQTVADCRVTAPTVNRPIFQARPVRNREPDYLGHWALAVVEREGAARALAIDHTLAGSVRAAQTNTTAVKI